MAETSTLTLTDFLLARIAEDEAEADRWARDPGEECFECAGFSAPRPPDRLDYERWPAECEAKRRIVETWQRRWDEAEAAAEDSSRSPQERGAMNRMYASQATGLGQALHLLALPYADHPDYRDEWRL